MSIVQFPTLAQLAAQACSVGSVGEVEFENLIAIPKIRQLFETRPCCPICKTLRPQDFLLNISLQWIPQCVDCQLPLCCKVLSDSWKLRCRSCLQHKCDHCISLSGRLCQGCKGNTMQVFDTLS